MAPAAYFLENEGEDHRRVPIPPEGLSVGRVRDANQLVLAGPEISRRHASLSWNADGSLRVVDLSVNGTFINGQRVQQQAVLRPGDAIAFGGPAPSFRLCGDGRAAPVVSSAASHGVVAASASSHTVASSYVSSSAAAASASARPTPAVASEPAARLDLVVDRYHVTPVPLPQRLVLGRAPGPGCLVISHPSVSAAHAEVLSGPGGTRLRDLGSRNGTFVNEEQVTDVLLAEGDLIQLGSCDSHVLLFREGRRRPLHLSELDVSGSLVTLGRGENNSVCLDHPTVSLHHAEIRNQGGMATLVDKGSTNGTYVNGAPVLRPVVLHAGDRVHLGAMEFIYDGTHFEGSAQASGTRLSAMGLRVEVRDRRHEPKLLLDDISLVIEPRQFVGLLGGSGAGKSTLMDALNGARPAQNGTVLLNQSNLYADYAALRSIIGYVPQDDILHTDLTARECLYYSARLRLPDDYGEAALWRKVQEVLHTLELQAQADLLVRALSGGQRKRVSVGIELLSNPGILFLDEPTAGQDPKNEQQMMQLFRRLANRGASVIINTHLLGSFGLLDRVAVLVAGKMAYYGPAPQMLGYFNCEQPHEVYYRLKDQALPEEWRDRYLQSPQFRTCVSAPLSGMQVGGKQALAAAPAAQPAAPAKPKHAVLRQTATLLARQWCRRQKDKMGLAVLILPPTFIALLIGWMDWPARGANGRQLFNPNTPMSLFMMVLIGLWFGCSATVREIVDETAVYRRERQRDLNLSSYIASKLIYLGALAGVQSALFIVAMAALHVVAFHLAMAWGLMWLLTVQGGLIGLLISAFADTAERALYIFPLVMIAELLFAGLLVPTAPMRPFYAEVQWGAQGQAEAMQLHPQPSWLPMVPPMSPALRNSLASVMISRWSLEALSNLYSVDLGHLPACIARQQSGPSGDNCAYSLELTNLVALTFRPKAAAEARDYVQGLAREMASPAAPAPSLPPSDAGGEYLAMQAAFAAVMIAAIALAMRRKEGRHAAGH